MSHGSSPAAWTAVLVCLLGITIGGLALIPDPNWTLFWVGVGITLLSGIIGRVMAAAGLGLDQPEL
ncbi:HGxxPAAW family protein [Aeromicrobium sp.]|uniref:HGxxPAAW family protein n=1 Tax=Aeromicrobium sp. TaxID=1871063 RepID=UPI003C39772F